MKRREILRKEKPPIPNEDDLKEAFDKARAAPGDKDLLVRISYYSLRQSDFNEKGRPVTVPKQDFNVEMHPLHRDNMAADLLKIYQTVGIERILFERVYDLNKPYDETFVRADSVIPAEMIQAARDNFEWSHKNWLERLFSKKPAEIQRRHEL